MIRSWRMIATGTTRMMGWAVLFFATAMVGAPGASAPEGQARPAGLVSYSEAVRCAGLTQAASELEGGESARGRTLYDAALYWSLAAMQAGRTAGRGVAAGETDQTRARITAVDGLGRDQPESRAALARCLTLAPDLD